MIHVLTAMLHDREAAEDCAHDAFVNAFEKWPKWKPTAPAEAWMVQIAKNAAISWMRKRGIRTAEEYIRRVGEPRLEYNPLDVFETQDVRDALASLPPKQREAITLRYFHGFTNRAISRKLGCPERTIASRLSVARVRLAAILASTYSKAA